jgi:hypothetical protein
MGFKMYNEVNQASFTNTDLPDMLMAANNALNAYAELPAQHNKQQAQDRLANLLCDLQHYAKVNQLDWAEAVLYASRHFNWEHTYAQAQPQA